MAPVPLKSISHAHSPPLVALGAAIRRARGAMGMSQEALAFEAGLDRSYMGGIERGEQNVALINLMKIASSLGLPASALLASAGL
jgi:transcriptional regulator with XRE-family HTH domain